MPFTSQIITLLLVHCQLKNHGEQWVTWNYLALVLCYLYILNFLKSFFLKMRILNLPILHFVCHRSGKHDELKLLPDKLVVMIMGYPCDVLDTSLRTSLDFESCPMKLFSHLEFSWRLQTQPFTKHFNTTV